MIRHTGPDWQFRYGNAWRTLKDPDGPATPAQLARLNRTGRLRIVAHAAPVTKLAAAQAIDEETT